MSDQPPVADTRRVERGRPRILIADDHEWIRRILVDVTRQTLPEAEITEVEDGQQALAAYHASGATFLVTNHAMPNLDGTELIRAVRRENADLPILMVSVHPEAEADARTAGATWFLAKKQIMEEMPALLREHA